MQAIQVARFGGPEVLVPAVVPEPTPPGPGQVLVEVHAAGVNPVDTYIRSGAYARLPALPYIPGWDGAGVVRAIGTGVSGLVLGDRVYFSGTAAGRAEGAYAELALCTRRQVWPLPDRLSCAQGAAIGVPYATAWRALHQRGGAQPGERLLVHGASGAVGIAAVQLGRAHGMTVIGTAGSDRGLDLVRAQGAHHALRHGTPGSAAEIREAAGGNGLDVIIEMLANVNLDTDLGLLATGGRVVVVGNRGRIEIDPRQTMARESSILGMSLWHVGEEGIDAMHRAMADGFADGSLTPVVGQRCPLARAAEAHQTVLAGGTLGKVVLDVR